jgi:hypothetical protein
MLRQRTHAGKNSQDFLGMMQYVIGFLPDLHQHVQHLRIDPVEPRMQRIELIAQQQTDGFHALGASRRQRSEQYFTWFQSRSHFFRHAKGRPQHRQGLLGKKGFRCMAGLRVGLSS